MNKIHAAILAAAVCLGAGSSVRAETVNRILAIVNEEIVTQVDVELKLQMLAQERAMAMPTGDMARTMREAIFERLIAERLMVQEAKRREVPVGNDEIDERFEQSRQAFESDDVFEGWLAAMGSTRQKFRERIHEQLLIKKITDAAVRAQFVVSPADVAMRLTNQPARDALGDRVRVSHVLIRVSEERAEEEARGLIETLRRKLEAGADFAELAGRFSEDPHAADGGDMGWVAAGELMPELDAVLMSLETGQLSDVIQTRLGFHLVRCEERRSASSLSLLEANSAVYNEIYQERFAATMQAWLQGLRDRAHIEILRGPHND